MLIWIITGANRGLGLEFATQLSTSPENTIIASTRSLDRSLPELKSLEQTSKATFHILECDTSSPPSISQFCTSVSDLLGPTTKIDFLLNNAGINANSRLTALNLTPEAFTNHMNTNVLGPTLLVQGLERHLGEGSVVMNMTSGLGSLFYNRSKEMPECTIYAMSKAALNMLTVHQAAVLKGRGTKVVCVDPGWVKTDMGGKGAEMEKKDSIEGMLELVRGLKEGDDGKFFLYDGTEKEW